MENVNINQNKIEILNTLATLLTVVNTETNKTVIENKIIKIVNSLTID